MSSQVHINNLITQNNWTALAIVLKNEHGFIGWLGGRYSCGAYIEIDGFSDINKICWRVFEASQSEAFQQLPNDTRMAVSKVIKELRRIYNETQAALSNASYAASIATRAYDLYEKIYDGFQPIQRLEDVVLSDLETIDLNQKV